MPPGLLRRFPDESCRCLGLIMDRKGARDPFEGGWDAQANRDVAGPKRKTMCVEMKQR